MKITERIKNRWSIFLVLLLLLVLSKPVYAWNLQLGIHHLMPKLWTGEQTYEGESGDTLQFKPEINQTIIGQGLSVGFFYENILFHFEQTRYRFDTAIPAENDAVSSLTEAEVEITEQRLGVNYHLERELAGIFAGIGMTREKEIVSAGSKEWVFETDVPFLKFGIDMILGSWRIRVEQIHFGFGEHSAKVSSAGILLFL